MSDISRPQAAHRGQQFSTSPLFSTVSRPINDLLLITSAYFLFAGHHQPGGGFVGGLIGSAALVVVYLVGGNDNPTQDRSLGAMILRTPTFPLGLGLLLAVGVAFLSVMTTGLLLDHQFLTVELFGIGSVVASTTLLFDTGVYLVVMGLVATMLHIYGNVQSPNEYHE